MTVGAIRVFLADDDEDDRFLVARALRATSWDCALEVVGDGEALIASLKRDDGPCLTPTQPRPGLVLLDLNMPCMDGRETLAAIRSDPELRHVPVVVLSTSNAAGDVESCYALGASSYLVKPRAYDALVDAMQRLMDYWSDLVLMPHGVTRSDRP